MRRHQHHRARHGVAQVGGRAGVSIFFMLASRSGGAACSSEAAIKEYAMHASACRRGRHAAQAGTERDARDLSFARLSLLPGDGRVWLLPSDSGGEGAEPCPGSLSVLCLRFPTVTRGACRLRKNRVRPRHGFLQASGVWTGLGASFP